jgi:type VI secretion system protein VasI
MVKKIIFLILIFLLISVSGYTENLSHDEVLLQIEKITNIANEEKRLEAYDNLANKLGFNIIEKEKNNIEDTGKWEVEVEKDPLTEKKEITLLLADNDSLGSGESYNMKGIIIRLSNDTPQLFIAWSDYLADNNTIKWKLDDGNINEEKWSMSTSSKALFFPDRTKSLKDFIIKLINAENFVANVQPYNERAQSAMFDVRGLGNAILPYLDDFGWTNIKKHIQ